MSKYKVGQLVYYPARKEILSIDHISDSGGLTLYSQETGSTLFCEESDVTDVPQQVDINAIERVLESIRSLPPTERSIVKVRVMWDALTTDERNAFTRFSNLFQ